MFKSYYVVWKHFLKPKNTVDEKGLNRTMQYGNFSQTKKIRHATTFKSYYVVWKRPS